MVNVHKGTPPYSKGKNTLNLIASLLSLIEKTERQLLVALLSTIVLLSFIQVVLRQFFATGILWGDVFLRHMVLWVGFFGAFIAASQNKHFAIDVLLNRLPPKVRFAVCRIVDLFSVLCLGFLTVAAGKFILDEWKYGSALFSVGGTEVPAVYLELIIPLAFFILTVHAVLQSARGALEKYSRPT